MDRVKNKIKIMCETVGILTTTGINTQGIYEEIYSNKKVIRVDINKKSVKELFYDSSWNLKNSKNIDNLEDFNRLLEKAIQEYNRITMNIGADITK